MSCCPPTWNATSGRVRECGRRLTAPGGRRPPSRVRLLFSVVALLALGGTTTAASAADADQIIFPATGRAAAPAVTTGGSLGSVSLVLGLALAAVGAWFVWRGRLATPIGRDTRQLAISETRSLGNRQYLVVASYEDKKFLLGVCPGRIDLLAPLHESSPEKPRA